MKVYKCIKPVLYGRRQYSPDAQDEKSRIIRLPVEIMPDDIINTHFSLISGNVTADTVIEKPKEKPQIFPDLLKKLENEQKQDIKPETKEQVQPKKQRGRPKRR